MLKIVVFEHTISAPTSNWYTCKIKEITVFTFPAGQHIPIGLIEKSQL